MIDVSKVYDPSIFMFHNGRVAVQRGSNVSNIPLTSNVLFDTLGKLDSVETARKVIDDIDDLCN